MNLYVPERFDERIDRLSVGVEPLDALREQRIRSTLDVSFDGIPTPPPRRSVPLHFGIFPLQDTLERLPRHDSGVHVLLERPGLKSPLPLRFNDLSRRFVPRRLTAPIVPGLPLFLRPAFHPGAAYDVSNRVTGARGRVLWDASTAPVRWCRVEARLPADIPRTGTVVARAHGDDRGEFLLLLPPDAAPLGDLVNPLPLELSVYGPAAAPVPVPPELPTLDPLWDLPLEAVPAFSPDPVSPGIALPPGYGPSPTSTFPASFLLGQVISLPDLHF